MSQDGKMRVVLAPDSSSEIKTRDAAIRKLKERKKSQKSKMVKAGRFTEEALENWVKETQAGAILS